MDPMSRLVTLDFGSPAQCEEGQSGESAERIIATAHLGQKLLSTAFSLQWPTLFT
jgi:hypothetical protein